MITWLWNSIFNFFNNKNFFTPIRKVTNFAIMFLYFDILAWLPTSNLGSLSLSSTPKSIYVLDFTWIGFILVVLCVLWYSLLTILPNLSIYTFCDIEVIYLWILLFKVLINLSAKQIFLHNVLHAYLYRYPATMISLIHCKTHYIYPYFAWSATIGISNWNSFFIFSRNNPCIFTINTNNA